MEQPPWGSSQSFGNSKQFWWGFSFDEVWCRVCADSACFRSFGASVSSFLHEFKNKTHFSEDLTSKVHVNHYPCIYIFLTVLDVLEIGATIWTKKCLWSIGKISPLDITNMILSITTVSGFPITNILLYGFPLLILLYSWQSKAGLWLPAQKR